MNKDMHRVWAIGFLLCVGCAGIGFAPGNTPTTLQGTLTNGVYRSADGRFSVALPLRNEDPSLRYLQITEQYGAHSSILSFGPAAYDHSIFRLELVHKTTLQSRLIKLKNIAQPILDGLMSQMAAEHGVLPVIDQKNTLTLAGRDTLHWRLYQMFDKGPERNPQALRHEIYMIDFPDDAAIIWVQLDPKKFQGDADTTAQQFASSLAFE